MPELAELIFQSMLDGRVPLHLLDLAEKFRLELIKEARKQEGSAAPPGPASVGGKASPPPIPGSKPKNRPRKTCIFGVYLSGKEKIPPPPDASLN